MVTITPKKLFIISVGVIFTLMIAVLSLLVKKIGKYNKILKIGRKIKKAGF